MDERKERENAENEWIRWHLCGDCWVSSWRTCSANALLHPADSNMSWYDKPFRCPCGALGEDQQQQRADGSESWET